MRNYQDCGRIRIGRGRDSRAPRPSAAGQGRPPTPLPGNESRLQSGRDQVDTRLEAQMCETHSCAHAVSGGQESLQRRLRNPGPEGFLGQRHAFEISRCDQSCREGSKRRQAFGRARSVPSKANSQRTTSCGSDRGRPPAGAVITPRLLSTTSRQATGCRYSSALHSGIDARQRGWGQGRGQGWALHIFFLRALRALRNYAR